MVGTRAGAAVNPWVLAQRECARVYNERKEAAAKEAAKEAKACSCRKGNTKAEKTREVDAEVRKEQTAAKARRTAHAKALKDDDARVQRAIQKGQEPAQKARREKLAEHARQSEKALHDEATAKALATVARRLVSTKTPDPARR